MVRGRKIEENAVADYLQDVDLIIAHNAQFDRTFLETTFPSLPSYDGILCMEGDRRLGGVFAN
jgi:DNA polymerase III epsilon subunit-like protein